MYIIVPATVTRGRYSIIFYYNSDIIKNIDNSPTAPPNHDHQFNSPPPPPPPAPTPKSGYAATRYAPPRNTYNTTT